MLNETFFESHKNRFYAITTKPDKTTEVTDTSGEHLFAVIAEDGSVYNSTGKIGDLSRVGTQYRYYDNPNRGQLLTMQTDRTNAIKVMFRTIESKCQPVYQY